MIIQGLHISFVALPSALGKRRERLGRCAGQKQMYDAVQLRGACCCSELLWEGPRIGHGKRGRIELEKVGGVV